jgi:hypothetical protein
VISWFQSVPFKFDLRRYTEVKRLGMFPVGFMEAWPPVEAPVVGLYKLNAVDP